MNPINTNKRTLYSLMLVTGFFLLQTTNAMELEPDDYDNAIKRWSCKNVSIAENMPQIFERDKTALTLFVEYQPLPEQEKIYRMLKRIKLKTEICFLKKIRYSDREFQIWQMRNAIFCIGKHKDLLDEDDKSIIKQTITDDLFSDLLDSNDIVMFGGTDTRLIQRFNGIMLATIKPIINNHTTSLFTTYYNSNIALLYESIITKWQSSENVQTFLPFLHDYTKGLVSLKSEKEILQRCIDKSQITDKKTIQSILDRINAKIAVGKILTLIESNENPEYISKRSRGDIVCDRLKFDIPRDLLKKLRLQSGIVFFSFRDIYLMNQIIKIKNNLAILDQFDKAEIANSSCLLDFLTKCTTQENWTAIEKNLADPENKFLIACLDVKNEIMRIKNEITYNEKQRTIFLSSIIATAYPYPDDHFTKIITQIHSLQLLIKEKFRSEDEIETLKETLSEYENILNQHIETVIAKIEHMDKLLYRFHGLSHGEWIKKIAVYFPQDNPDLVKLLMEKGYQLHIDAKLAQLAEAEKQIAAREEAKKMQVQAQQKLLEARANRELTQKEAIEAKIKAARQSTFVPVSPSNPISAKFIKESSMPSKINQQTTSGQNIENHNTTPQIKSAQNLQENKPTRWIIPLRKAMLDCISWTLQSLKSFLVSVF